MLFIFPVRLWLHGVTPCFSQEEWTESKNMRQKHAWPEEFMPCTKNKTELLSKQKEPKAAGSNTPAIQLLYAIEEAIQEIPPDTDDEGGRQDCPWGRGLPERKRNYGRCAFPAFCW